jgi:6-phosphogluconate dehydrogenase (decarboxylating)
MTSNNFNAADGIEYVDARSPWRVWGLTNGGLMVGGAKGEALDLLMPVFFPDALRPSVCAWKRVSCARR